MDVDGAVEDSEEDSFPEHHSTGSMRTRRRWWLVDCAVEVLKDLAESFDVALSEDEMKEFKRRENPLVEKIACPMHFYLLVSD